MNKQISGKDSEHIRELSNRLRRIRESDYSLQQTLNSLCKVEEDLNDIINRYTVKALNQAGKKLEDQS